MTCTVTPFFYMALANATLGGVGSLASLGVQFLKTLPPQVETEFTWLTLPLSLRFVLQLVGTLLLSLLALRLLAPSPTPHGQAATAPAPAPSERMSPAPRESSSQETAEAPEGSTVQRAVTIVSIPPVTSASSTAAPPPAPSGEARAAAPLPWRSLAAAAACVLVGVLICVAIDRWHMIPILAKIRVMGADSIIAICLAIFGAAAFAVSFEPKDATALVSTRQTDEWKGAAMLVFLLYHYWDWKTVRRGGTGVVRARAELPLLWALSYTAPALRSLALRADLHDRPLPRQPVRLFHGLRPDPLRARQGRVRPPRQDGHGGPAHQPLRRAAGVRRGPGA